MYIYTHKKRYRFIDLKNTTWITLQLDTACWRCSQVMMQCSTNSSCMLSPPGTSLTCASSAYYPATDATGLVTGAEKEAPRFLELLGSWPYVSQPWLRWQWQPCMADPMFVKSHQLLTIGCDLPSKYKCELDVLESICLTMWVDKHLMKKNHQLRHGTSYLNQFMAQFSNQQ